MIPLRRCRKVERVKVTAELLISEIIKEYIFRLCPPQDLILCKAQSTINKVKQQAGYKGLSLSAGLWLPLLMFGGFSTVGLSMKCRVRFPPQDRKISLIHLFSSLATRMQLVTEALAWNSESGTQDTPFWWRQQQVCRASGGSGARSGFSVRCQYWQGPGYEVPKWGLGCRLPRLSWCRSIFRVQCSSFSNDAVIYQISFWNISFSAGMSQSLPVAHTQEPLTIDTLGNLLAVFYRQKHTIPQIQMVLTNSIRKDAYSKRKQGHKVWTICQRRNINGQ